MKTATKIILAALAVGAAAAPIVYKSHQKKVSKLKAAEASLELTDEEVEALDKATRTCHCIGDNMYNQDADPDYAFKTSEKINVDSLDSDSSDNEISFDGNSFYDSNGKNLTEKDVEDLLKNNTCIALNLEDILKEHNMSYNDFIMGFALQKHNETDNFCSMLVNYFKNKKENGSSHENPKEE